MHNNMNVSVSGPQQPASTYKTKVLKGQVPFATQVTEPNMKYVIKHNFDLGGESVTIPENCVLEFDGGSLSNGTVIGDNSVIKSSPTVIFKNINIAGDWQCDGRIEWFVANSNFAVSSELQLALDSSFKTLRCDSGDYYIESTIELKSVKKLYFGTTKIHTNQNITILKIKPNSVFESGDIFIDGGELNVKSCSNYSSTCVEIDISGGGKCDGLYINSTLIGRSGLLFQEDSNNYGIKLITANNNQKGFLTSIFINGMIEDFITGVDFNVVSGSSQWCTGLNIIGRIWGCKTAYDVNIDSCFTGIIQPPHCFNEQNNNTSIINLNSNRHVLGGMIWDVGGADGSGYYSNQYVADISEKVTYVEMGEHVKALYHNNPDYFKGNTLLISEVQDVHNFPSKRDNFNYLFNYAESLLLKGGTLTCSVKDEQGNDKNITASIVNENTLFNSNSSSICIVTLSQIPDETDYLELTLTFPSSKPVRYCGINIEANTLENDKYVCPCTKYEVATGLVKRELPILFNSGVAGAYYFQPIDFKGKVDTTYVKLRFKGIKNTILRFQQVVIQLQHRNIECAFLPISGGNVYGNTTFKGGLVSETPAQTEVNPADSRFYTDGGNQEIMFLESSPRTNTSSTLDTQTAIVCLETSIDDSIFAIYKISFIGGGGIDRVSCIKIAGGCNYAIKAYYNSATRKFILTVNNVRWLWVSNLLTYTEGVKIKNERITADLLQGYTQISFRTATVNNVTSDGSFYIPGSAHYRSGVLSFWNGTKWVAYDGAAPGVARSGETRPVGSDIYVGFQFFDTSVGINKPIYASAISGDIVTWVDATGATV